MNRGGIDFESNLGEFIFPDEDIFDWQFHSSSLIQFQTNCLKGIFYFFQHSLRPLKKLSADVIKISSLEENMTRLQRDLVRGIEKKLKKMICDEKLTLGLH